MEGVAPRWPRAGAALLGFLGVAAGAFGAHGLRDLVTLEQLTNNHRPAPVFQRGSTRARS